MTRLPVSPLGALLGALFFALVALASPAAAAKPIVDLDVVADSTLTRNADAAIDVTVRLARSLTDIGPLQGARVRLALEDRDGGSAVTLLEGTTGPDGRLRDSVRIPDLDPGDRDLIVTAEAPEGQATARIPVSITDASVLVLRTDKGIYRPGQALRFAVVAYNDATGRPVADARATVEVVGPRNIKVWRGELDTDASGMVAGELPLADDLLLGTYTLSAHIEGASTSETVDVRKPVMPAFAVDVSIDGVPAAGQPLRGVVEARYLYGEPVAGPVRVDVTVGDADITSTGSTDAAGRFPFEALIPASAAGEAIRVMTHVTDGAGRKEQGSANAMVPGGPLTVVIVPETLSPQAGRPVRVTAFALDASGAIAPARLRLRVAGRDIARSEDLDGILQASVATKAPRMENMERWPRGWVHGYDTMTTSGEQWNGLDLPDSRGEALATCTRLGPAGGEADLVLSGRKGVWRLDRAFLTARDDGLYRAVDHAEIRACVSRALSGLAVPRGTVWTRLNVTVGEEEIAEWSDPVPVTVEAIAETADGRRVTETAEFTPVAEGAGLLVRALRPVVEPGAPVEIEVEQPRGRPLVATLLVGDVPVASGPVLDGRASLMPPTGTHGLVVARVTSLPTAGRSGVVDAELGGASVYVAPRAVTVAIETAGRVRPGQDTEIRVRVTGDDGAPLGGVGIAASVVDERVLRLSATRPTLAELFASTGLDHAELAGVHFVDLMTEPQTRGRDVMLAAILQDLGAAPPTPWIDVPAVARLEEQRARIVEARSALTQALAGLKEGVVRRGPSGAWELSVSVEAALTAAGWTPESLRTPFDTVVDQPWLEALHGPMPIGQVAEAVTWMRLQEVVDQLWAPEGAKEKLAAGPLPATALLADGSAPVPPDAWGGALMVRRGRGCLAELVSGGPDAVAGTDDDLFVHTSMLCEPQMLGYAGMGMAGHGVGGGGVAYGSSSMRSVGTIGIGGGMGSTRTVAVRKRFDETVLWVAGVPTDAQGFALLDVSMADSITGWKVSVDALSPDGRAGSGTAHLETFLPLHVDAEVPDELTIGDSYTLTAVAANHSGRELPLTIRAEVSGAARLDGPATRELVAADGATAAVPFPIHATESGEATVTLTLLGPDGPVDAVERTLRVEPPGHLEQALATASMRGGAGELAMTVPGAADRKSMRSRLRLYRGPADEAIDGVEDMLREPHGCFEQTSSTTYPNLLILRLLKGSEAAADIRKKAEVLVLKGYQRLLTFEVDGGGFSWFGSAPANRVLTAYGLVEFVDMARVSPVDPALIARTRGWLVGLQGDDGSWEPDKSWLHDWSAVQGAVSTTAWIAWALAEAGGADEAVGKGLAFLRAHETDLAERPYLLALWAAAERAASDAPERPLALLAERAEREGDTLRWSAGGQTLLYGGGKAADVEVTAMALRGLIGDARQEADRAATRRWLWSARSPSYGWGTTQATVQTLRGVALMAEDAGRPATGPARVLLDGREVGVLDLDAPELPTLDLPGLAAGPHTVAIETEDKGALLADLRSSWRRLDDPAPIAQGLEVSLRHKGGSVQVGRTTRLILTVRNPSDALVPMPTVVAPVPPGFRATDRSLRELETLGLVTRADDQGSEIHLYREQLAAGASVTLTWDLEATAACDVTQRGARAYAYYDPETRGTSGNLRLVATPR